MNGWIMAFTPKRKNVKIKIMIKRIFKVIGVAIAIVFVPYFLGMVEINKTFSTIPIYLRGIMYVCAISVTLFAIHRIVWYIKEGN